MLHSVIHKPQSHRLLEYTCIPSMTAYIPNGRQMCENSVCVYLAGEHLLGNFHVRGRVPLMHFYWVRFVLKYRHCNTLYCISVPAKNRTVSGGIKRHMMVLHMYIWPLGNHLRWLDDVARSLFPWFDNNEVGGGDRIQANERNTRYLRMQVQNTGKQAMPVIFSN